MLITLLELAEAVGLGFTNNPIYLTNVANIQGTLKDSIMNKKINNTFNS